MSIVTKTLYRTIGIPYYQRNAGLFLFLFIMLFGVVHGNELWYYHFSLALAINDSVIIMGLVCLLWLLYNLKCIQFVQKSLSEPQNSFLNVIACLSKREQLFPLFLLQLFLFLPVLLYSLFVAGVGIYSSCYPEAMFVVCYNLLVCFVTALFYRKKINHPDSGKPLYSIPFLKFNFRKSYPVIFITWLFNEAKMIFFVTKFFSLIVLIAFLNGFFIDVKDSRIPFLGLLPGLVAHCVLVFELRKFEETRFSFNRNLPVPLLKRFFWIAEIYFMILIPEIIVLVSSISGIISPFDFILLTTFGTSLLMLFHCLLYLLKTETKTFIEIVFATCSILFFLILYSAYFIILAMLMLTSALIFFSRYFRYENVIEKE